MQNTFIRALRPLARSARPPAARLPPFSHASLRPFSTSSPFHHSTTTPSPSILADSSNSTPQPEDDTPPAFPSNRTPIGKIERRLQITFTCTAHHEERGETCSHRSTHEFGARSYEKGIVLIECPSCQNRHLIADNLSWFSDTPSPAFPKGLPTEQRKTNRTVEDLVKEKGEKVKWIDGGPQGGTWELEG